MNRMPNVRQPKSLLSLYLKDISAYSLLTREEEIRLGHLARQGNDAAIQRLVEGNLRFVVKIAKRYHGLRLSLLDLIHEGNLGLIVAAKRFDPSRGVRFLSYAVWWIRQSILFAISTYGHTFRLPVKIGANMFRINTLLAKQKESGLQPTREEMATETGLAATEIELAMRLKLEPISLHQPLYSDDDRTLEEVLPDMAHSGPELKLMNDDLKRHLKGIVDRLTSREQQVLALRFGLAGDEPQTLGEIGAQLGVCRERVRQIQLSAMHKLRESDAARGIAIAFA